MLHASFPVVAHVGSSTAQLFQDPDNMAIRTPVHSIPTKHIFWGARGLCQTSDNQKILPKIEHPSGKDDSVCQCQHDLLAYSSGPLVYITCISTWRYYTAIHLSLSPYKQRCLIQFSDRYSNIVFP